MFEKFKYESVPLKDIALDDRNPRIVTQVPLSSQGEIVSYLYENEDLEAFIKKISSEGKNIGADLKALALQWTHTEKDILLKPNLAFNPPVRFLQTSGHKEKVGINYDSTNLKVVFDGKEAEKKFKHLLGKLVITPTKGLGATATYDAVFADYGTAAAGKPPGGKKTSGGSSSSSSGGGGTGGGGGGGSGKPGAGGGTAPKPGALFSYPVKKINNALVTQLMKEAKEINCKKYPAAATFLLRNIVETILKHIIDDQGANKTGQKLDLEGSLNLCIGNNVKLSHADNSILSEFKKDHLAYLNLGAHGNVIPNETRVVAARDTIDQFVKRHV